MSLVAEFSEFVHFAAAQGLFADVDDAELAQAFAEAEAALSPPPSESAEPPPGPAPADDQVATPDRDGAKAEQLLQRSKRDGTTVLAAVTKSALQRWLAHGPRVLLQASNFFDAAERQRLADSLAATTATANLLGRARIRLHQARVEKRHGDATFSESHALPLPVRLQRSGYSCGAAALRSVLAFHGISETEQTLADVLGTDPQGGTSPSDILAVVRSLPLTAEAHGGMTADDLKCCCADSTPVLCPIQLHGGGHWVAVAGVTPTSVVVMDPAAGTVAIPIGDFLAAWHDTDSAGQRFDRYGIAIGPRADAVHFGEAEHESPLAVFDEGSLRPLTPSAAVEYFRRLVPRLRVDVPAFDRTTRQDSFTLAGVTELGILDRIKAVISGVLETGKDVSDAPRRVGELLDLAGLSQRNPQRAEMIVRTSMVNAYNTGATEEMSDPDVAATYPVWKWIGIRDGRQRASHERFFDRYYPNGVSMADVRDGHGFDGFNERCTLQPVDKWTWKRLQAAGARVESSWG